MIIKMINVCLLDINYIAAVIAWAFKTNYLNINSNTIGSSYTTPYKKKDKLT